VIVAVAACLFLNWNNQGWESNHLLAIGIGGGSGWVMMLNVWGVIWRIQTSFNGPVTTPSTHPIPDKAKAMARQAFLASRANAFLSMVVLFFMGAASYYPLFGK
jgi:uncharacterized membrane protein